MWNLVYLYTLLFSFLSAYIFIALAKKLACYFKILDARIHPDPALMNLRFYVFVIKVITYVPVKLPVVRITRVTFFRAPHLFG